MQNNEIKLLFLSPYTKNNSKQIKDLNIRTETINYTKENMSTELIDISLRVGI